MKRLVVAIVMSAVLLSVAACGGEAPDTQPPTQTEQSSASTLTPETTETRTPQEEYAGWLRSQRMGVGQSLQIIGSQLQDFSPQSERWIEKTTTEIRGFRSLWIAGAREKQPPESMQELHATYLHAMDEFEAMLDSLETVIDDPANETAMDALSRHLEQGGAYLQQATNMLDALTSP